MVSNDFFHTKTVCLKAVILVTTFKWAIGLLPNRLERSLAGSAEDVISKQLRGIEKIN